MGLWHAAGDGRLEDVKEHVQNGVAVNEKGVVSNYIYTYFTLLEHLIMCTAAYSMCVASRNNMFSVNK